MKRLILSLLVPLGFALPVAAQAQQADRYAFTQDYEPAPAMWRLADEDTTIYMLGTIHLLPEGFRWRSPQLDAIIAEADVLVVETSNADADPAMEAMFPKIANLMAARVPTSQRLSPVSRSRWRDMVTLMGLPFEEVDSMPIMVAMMGLGQSGIREDRSSYDHGVETVLEAEFSRSGRPIESIEDAGLVMYSLYRANETEALRELDMQLRDWGGKSMDGLYDPAADELTGNAYWEMEHNWARGLVQEDFDLGFGDGAIGRAFNDVLLNRRNTRWAVWLDERLDRPGTVLLAVGAGHFEGPNSVLAKLAAHGLTAERIN